MSFRFKANQLRLMFAVFLGFAASAWYFGFRLGADLNRQPSNLNASKAMDRCKVENLSQAVVSGTIELPKYLYHYGPKGPMLENVAAHTVPQQKWDEFVMGGRTATDLHPYRRGLYGTEHPSDADRFGEKRLDQPDRWPIRILLTEQCRKPERIFSILDLPKDLRFQNWVKSNKQGRNLNLKNKVNRCFAANGQLNERQFKLYGVKGKPLTVCEKLVTEFFSDMNPGIILDPVQGVPRSWQIRDRACIQDIVGNEQQWAKLFLDEPELWRNDCTAHSHAVRMDVWIDSLLSLPEGELLRMHFVDWTAWFKKFQLIVPAVETSWSSVDQNSKNVDLANFASQWVSAFQNVDEVAIKESLRDIKNSMGKD